MTTRLCGSLPASSLEDTEKTLSKDSLYKSSDISLMNKQQQRFLFYEEILDSATNGPRWLADPRVAKAWQDALMFFHGKRYVVICSTVMSNHVHFIFTDLTYPIGKIMGSIKGFSAKSSNRILGREGQFWQREFFDRLIRNESDLRSKIRYVLNNPVKAGIVSHWEDFEFNYLNPSYVQYMN